MSAQAKNAVPFAEVVANAQAAIDTGRTLPAAWYTNPVVREAERGSAIGLAVTV
jgi:hypothetical protein